MASALSRSNLRRTLQQEEASTGRRHSNVEHSRSHCTLSSAPPQSDYWRAALVAVGRLSAQDAGRAAAQRESQRAAPGPIGNGCGNALTAGPLARLLRRRGKFYSRGAPKSADLPQAQLRGRQAARFAHWLRHIACAVPASAPDGAPGAWDRGGPPHRVRANSRSAAGRDRLGQQQARAPRPA